MKYFILLISLTSFLACTRPQEKLRKQIDEREQALSANSSAQPDRAKSDSLITLYIQYADAYQDDTLSPEYLFRAGDLSIGNGRFTEAQELFARVHRYPNYGKLPQVTFLQGFVAENHERDTTTARKYYENFLDKYPDHPLADDARAAIEHMGMSPEDLIRQFEQNLADSTANK